MDEKTLSLIKSGWLEKMSQPDLVVSMLALSVLGTMLIIAARQLATAKTQTLRQRWAIALVGFGLAIFGAALLLFAAWKESPRLYIASLAINEFLFIASLIVGMRGGLQIQTEVSALHDRLKNARQVLQDYQNSLEAIVNRRTQALRQEVRERRRVQSELAQTAAQRDAELLFASKVQKALLEQPPDLPFAHITVNYQPVSSVSGDTYSFIHDQDRVSIVLADAMGHGVAAALLTQLVLAATRGMPADRSGPEMFADLNQLIGGSAQDVYVTASWCRLHRNGCLQFCGAGNTDLLIWRCRTREIESLDGRGQALGMFDDIVSPFSVQEVQLEPGDRVFMFTDGLMEWTNADGVMFGLDGIERNVRQLADDLLPHAVAGIQNAAWEFADMNPCKDDVTMLAIEWLGESKTRS